MICPVCQTELEPEFIKTLEDKKERRYLRYGKKLELVFYCPNAIRHDGHGMNLWTKSWIESYRRMMKGRKKLKMSY